MYQWGRRFQFFDKNVVKEEGTEEPWVGLKKTCCTSGNGSLVFGDKEGMISMFDKDMKEYFWRAYQGEISFIEQFKAEPIVVAIGSDQEPNSSLSGVSTTNTTTSSIAAALPTGGLNLGLGLTGSTSSPTLGSPDPVIKFWNTEKRDKNADQPLTLGSIKIKAPRDITVTAFAIRRVDENFSVMAVGQSNGTVILYSGKRLWDNPNTDTVRFSEQIESVNGLGFQVIKDRCTLFIVTTAHVYSYLVSRDRIIKKEILDESIEVTSGCSCLNHEQDLVVARKDAVWFYKSDVRTQCFAFEGEKKMIGWFRSYLIIVGLETRNTQVPGGPAGIRNVGVGVGVGVGKGNSSINLVEKNTFNIYDLENQFIAYSDNFEGIHFVLSEWGSIFVVMNDGKMYRLEEKDTQTKLETLYKKNLYNVAIRLAINNQHDPSSIDEIYRKYGDHLYGKGDYDGAMNQYLNTIGRLEPSYVIRKFLDAQQITNLTKYLDTLHTKGLATADHTTLLVHCYTKLNDKEKLQHFIRNESSYDVETVLKVCRQAGYYKDAATLAKNQGKHDWYLKIQLEDEKDYSEALRYIEYISQKDVSQAIENLLTHGKDLVDSLPMETTNLLMKLCKFTDNQNADSDHSPENFIHIFVNQPYWLTVFLEYIVQEFQQQAPALISSTLLELYLRSDSELDQHDVSDQPTDQKETKQETYGGLSLSQDKKSRKEKALNLLHGETLKGDLEHALILCQMNNFTEGTLLLYKEMALFNEILEHYMDANDYDNVIDTCNLYGAQDPNMWVKVLSYFAVREDCENRILEVLQKIEKKNILPPLLVIQILSQTPNAKLKVIKEYITRKLQEENEMIEQDKAKIRSYKEDTEKMRTEIEELRTGAKVFQLTHCSACTTRLDLPAVHFLCNHSYHQRCLGENERECPICAGMNKKIMEYKRSLDENASQHEEFFKLLDGSPDGFSIVAEYFGRGIFNKFSNPHLPS